MPRKASDIREGKRLLAEYAEQHSRCAVCHFRKYRPGRRMEIHHLAGRRGSQPHDHRNLILICNICHHAVHNKVPAPFDTLTPACILTAKEEEDGSVDLTYLAQCRRKKHLGYDPAPIPEAYLNERSDNAGR